MNMDKQNISIKISKVISKLISKKVNKASFTIEAAAVMPIVLIVLVSMILMGYKMHDIFYSNVSANIAVEIYEHLSENGTEDIDSVAASENNRLDLLFSGRDYSLSMEEMGENGGSATVSGDGSTRTYEDWGFRPENTLRTVTVVEEIVSDE